ncbi:uncharacterized protein LOC130622785 [Hydractinia symbiolongicarpus]|uniref:uncharacterized protein LOC130622785 n=1 Tax=Hydractinia symbiolongicarpus TaxID=13093 RepID=UPI00254E5100|nr:uncharacterized protein LOC130622785 [Hydractinia symbiolongicarpus]
MVLRHSDGMLLQELYVLRKQNTLKNEQLKNSDFNLRSIKRKVEVEELKLKVHMAKLIGENRRQHFEILEMKSMLQNNKQHYHSSNGYIHTEPQPFVKSHDHQCKSNNADVSVSTTNLDNESPFSIITKMTRSPIKCSHDASTSAHNIFSLNYASYVQLLHRFSSRDAILDTRPKRLLCEPLADVTLSLSKTINRKSENKGFVT